jgi:L-ascorbate metabolism protein UlaG (beta-lactamase superfamily)
MVKNTITEHHTHEAFVRKPLLFFLIIMILFLFIVAGGFVLVLLCILLERLLLAAPRYTGPVTDHFNGSEFVTPNAPQQQGLVGVFKWIMNRAQGQWTAIEWQRRTDTSVGPPPPMRVEGDNLRVTFVNHATVLIQTAGLNILTDPVWSERASPFSFAGPKRVRPAGIRFDDLPPIDVVLLSHNHYDHLDVPTLKRLHTVHQPSVYVPLGVRALLEREGMDVAGELDWHESCPLRPSMEMVSSVTPPLILHCTPAQHFSGRGISDRNATLWCGYVLHSPTAGNIFFAGDTGYNAYFKQMRDQFGSFRLAILPIGAYRPEWFMSPVHLSPQDAVQAFQDLGSPQSMAIHYGTFPLADDGEREPVEALCECLKAASIQAERFAVLAEGEGQNW